MPPTRLQREGSSLDDLRASIREEFGPAARIVAAEKVTTGGLGGLFRKHHFEAIVEVPSPGESPVARVAIASDGRTRAGILALLEDAESAETSLTDVPMTRAARRSRRAADRPVDAPPVSARASTAVVLPTPVSTSMPAPMSGHGAGHGVGHRAADGAAPDLVPNADPVLATRSDAFASIMDDFTFNGLAPDVSLGEALASSSGDVVDRPREGARDGSVTTVGRSGGPAPALQSGTAVIAPDATHTDGGPVDARSALEAVALSRTGGTAQVARTSAPIDAAGLPMAPAVMRADGDLVVVVGRARDAEIVTGALARTHGVQVVEAGDRRGAILARAAGVQGGHGVASAFAWSTDSADRLRGIGADQVWVVVDAERKHEDTARVLRAVSGTVPLAGIVAVGMGETSSPETVHMFGLPVVDARDWS
ncbi:hypothetical protein [Curtobacterium sp. Leaf261]|uniref:hypothetical protein n=1 Tax=Curtobacterium sp. Leaf261 TaxID=1736311 RepID=UPI0006F503D3|nr:hypothetical protein [Curtobacterium sp. Leaf261]KQO64896.1 hypothetical protein ASF23_01625 [Curtobacterium sp. Leaf261]